MQQVKIKRREAAAPASIGDGIGDVAIGDCQTEIDSVWTMWDLLTSFDAWAALTSLAALEIVLGIDNVVFISILVGRLEPRRSQTARRLGLALALLFRIALLFALTSLMGLTATVFTWWDNPLSWRRRWLRPHHGSTAAPCCRR